MRTRSYFKSASGTVICVLLKLKLYANHANYAFKAETGSFTEVSRVLHLAVPVDSHEYSLHLLQKL